MVASRKRFFWLFQNRTERLPPLLDGVLADLEGDRFSARVINERNWRLDGLSLPLSESMM